MEFSRPEYWSSLSLLQGDLPNPGIELRSPAWQADSLPAETGTQENFTLYVQVKSFWSLCFLHYFFFSFLKWNKENSVPVLIHSSQHVHDTTSLPP